jgi:hypothetical protein
VVDLNTPDKRLLKCLSENWQAFSASLASVTQHPQFNEYLARYRGHSDSLSIDGQEPLRTLILVHCQTLVVSCFNQARLLPDQCSEELLKNFESAINTALYYWTGSSDRNFQFRTVVHFLGLADQDVVCNSEAGLFSFRLNEWGFSISQRDLFEIFPRRHSIAQVCGISLAENIEHFLVREQELFSVIRTMQREFCLLIDEWEHCNSILAVKQFSLRKLLQSDPVQGQSIMQEIVGVRNALAQWCVRTAADFQHFIAQVAAQKDLSSDVRAELSALDALILSGFQKFLLPASVSRHVYSNDVLLEFLRWTEARLKTHPDDLFSLTSDLVFRTALYRKTGSDALLSLLRGKSFHWTLSADPSAAIKAVCWGLSAFEHRFFLCVLAVILDAKLSPNALDSHWLQTLASVAEMPGTFQVPAKAVSDLSVASEDFESIHARAIATLERCCDHVRDDALKAVLFVLEFLRSEMPSSEALTGEGELQ